MASIVLCNGEARQIERSVDGLVGRVDGIFPLESVITTS
jgi:hypothetical protein